MKLEHHIWRKLRKKNSLQISCSTKKVSPVIILVSTQVHTPSALHLTVPPSVRLPPQLQLRLRLRHPNAAQQKDGELFHAPHLQPQHGGIVGQPGGRNGGHWLPAERQLSGCGGQEEALSSQVSPNTHSGFFVVLVLQFSAKTWLFNVESERSRLTALLL